MSPLGEITALGHVIDVPDVTLDPNYFGSGARDRTRSRGTAELIVLDTYARGHGLFGGRVLSSRIATGIDPPQSAPQL
jgi:hypothetical protein